MGQSGLLINLDWLANIPSTVSSSSATVSHVVLGIIAVVRNAGDVQSIILVCLIAVTNFLICASLIVSVFNLALLCC